MAIAIRLSEELENKLSSLAKKTKRSKSFYVREALEHYLEDIEDYYRGIEALNNTNRVYSSDEVRREFGLDDHL
jgi:RHH-type transcriptional regulator, rel operon repressor / antitoxin RelB